MLQLGLCARTEPGEPASAAGGDEESYPVRSADGVVLRWSRQAAEHASTLKNWIEERSVEEETGGEQPFPTPLSAKALETLRAACAHDGDEATSPLASLPLNETTDVLYGANFLEAEGVFAAASRRLCGILLARKSVDELRSALSAADDLSADEQKAALREPLHTPPAGAGAEEEGTAAAGTSSSASPAIRRSFSTRASNEDVLVTALQEADAPLLCCLKAVSRPWRVRARNELCRRVSCRGAGQLAPASLDAITELDVELLSAAGRAHEAAAAGRELPSLAWLHGWGFVVDVHAVRQADLSQVWTDGALATSPALRVCVAGEGEPPLELLLAAVACAASGEVLRVPVQQLREGDLVELDLSGRGVGVGGERLLALLLPLCSKLVRINLASNQLFGLDEYDRGKYTAEGINALCEALKGNTSLTFATGSRVYVFHLESPMGKAMNGMRGVVVSWRDDKERWELQLDLHPPNKTVNVKAANVRLASSLTSLDLSYNRMGPKDVAAIAEGLKGNMGLRSLDLGGNNLTGVPSRTTTSGRLVGEDMSGILKLAEALPRSQLTSLSLARTSLCRTWLEEKPEEIFDPILAIRRDPRDRVSAYIVHGINALCDALKGNTRLTSLNLADNFLEVEGGKAIAAVIGQTKITHLNLNGWNHLRGGVFDVAVDMSGILKLADAAKQSRLKELWLQNEGWGHDLTNEAKEDVRAAAGPGVKLYL